MLQLREDGSLCLRMSPAQAKQLTASSGTHGQPVEGPSEGSYTPDGPRQLHQPGLSGLVWPLSRLVQVNQKPGSASAGLVQPLSRLVQVSLSITI
jgi:hypothetical protein